TSPTTCKRYNELMRIHIIPQIGAVPLRKLHRQHIERAYGEMRAKGLSPRTIIQAHRVLREALQHAYEGDVIGRNPADGAKAPRAERFEVKGLPLADVRLVLAAADAAGYGAMVYIAVTTGLRLGELGGLRWADLDLDAGVLSVRQ